MNPWKKILSAVMAAAVCLSVAGCSSAAVDDDEVVMHVGDYDVTAEHYNYYFLNEKYSQDSGDSSYWTDVAASNTSLKEAADNSIKQFYAMKKMCDDAGITLNEAQNAQVEEEIAMLEENFGGEEAFNQVLASNYMSLELYRQLSEESLRTISLFETLFGDQIRERVANDYLRAAHILIQFDESAEDAETDKAATKAEAEEVLEKIQNGEDFFALVDEYNDDPGMVDNTDGYYFTEGEMVTPFYEGAIALEEGEVSDLVETEYGYHIIKRLPMEQEYIDANLMNFVSTEMYEDFFSQVEETQNSMEVTTESTYDKINLENAIKNEQNA